MTSINIRTEVQSTQLVNVSEMSTAESQTSITRHETEVDRVYTDDDTPQYHNDIQVLYNLYCINWKAHQESEVEFHYAMSHDCVILLCN